MEKKVIMIGGVPYYEANGGVHRVRDNPDLYASAKSIGRQDIESVFKKTTTEEKTTHTESK
jgi:hypothetical protein